MFLQKSRARGVRSQCLLDIRNGGDGDAGRGRACNYGKSRVFASAIEGIKRPKLREGVGSGKKEE